MAKCKTCGAPVNLAPDGDPKYESPYRAPTREAELREALKDLLEEFCSATGHSIDGSDSDPACGGCAAIAKTLDALSGSAPVQPAGDAMTSAQPKEGR